MQSVERFKTGTALTDADFENLEKEMLKLPQVDCPVIHRFSPGLYIREVTLKANTFAIGHYQKTEHLNIMLTGSVTIIRDDGSTDLLTAPLMYTSKPGRKIGWIHEEVVWLNVYPTTETDLDTLEKMFLDKSMTWNESLATYLLVAIIEHHLDREDYFEALIDLGVTHEQAQAETSQPHEGFPYGSYKCVVSDSPIDGKGLFATSPISEGETIAPARVNGMRTPAGRFTNHGVTPNAKMVFLSNGDVVLVALKEIAGSRGGSLGEEILTDYRVTYRNNRGELPCHL